MRKGEKKMIKKVDKVYAWGYAKTFKNFSCIYHTNDPINKDLVGSIFMPFNAVKIKASQVGVKALALLLFF